MDEDLRRGGQFIVNNLGTIEEDDQEGSSPDGREQKNCSVDHPKNNNSNKNVFFLKEKKKGSR